MYRALQARTWPLGHVVKHAVQGSNLPLPDLEAGASPLELPAHQRHNFSPAPITDQSPQSTHGWIRTTINAINNRALYRLSYMGVLSLNYLLLHCSTAPLLYRGNAAMGDGWNRTNNLRFMGPLLCR